MPTWFRLLAAGALAVLVTGCGTLGDGVPGDAAAVVDDGSIPRATLEDAINQLERETAEIPAEEREQVVGAQQRELLSLLILDELLTSLYEERGASHDDEDLEQVRSQVVEAVGGEEQLEDALAQAQLTVEIFEEVFVPQQARVLAMREQLAEGETLETRTVRHILVESEEEAGDVVDELDDGAEFGELAEERSVDPGSAAQGGELGAIERGTTVEEFDEAVWDAELDEVVGPVQSQFGFHVLEVTDEEQREADELSDAELDQLVGAELNALIEQAYDAAEIRVDPGIGDWDPAQRTVVPPGTVGEGSGPDEAPLELEGEPVDPDGLEDEQLEQDDAGGEPADQ